MYLEKSELSFNQPLSYDSNVNLLQVIRTNPTWREAPDMARRNLSKIVNIALKSKAESTTKSYRNIISNFFRWCKKNEISLSLPFHASVIALYIHDKSRKVKSSSSISVTSAALKWLHGLCPNSGVNPLDDDFCKNIIAAAKRRVSRPVQKKKPLSSQTVKDIIDKFGRNQNNLKELRTAALCTLGYAGFFRYDELRSIQANHIEFNKDHIKIFVPKSKTDIYREGQFVYIARIKSPYCPIEMLNRYMTSAKIDYNSALPIFRPVTYLKKSKTYVLRKGELSYSRCRELLKQALESLGYETKNYGLHSLRSGGISSVVQNSNNTVEERLLKLHGRWKTDTAKDMYVQETVNKRLQVTEHLGL